MSGVRFAKKTREQKKEIISARDKAIEEKDLAIKEAKRCLGSEAFQDFLIQYSKAEKQAIKTLFLIDRSEFDPIKYMMQMKNVLSDLRHARAFKETVYTKARRKSEDE